MQAASFTRLYSLRAIMALGSVSSSCSHTDASQIALRHQFHPAQRSRLQLQATFKPTPLLPNARVEQLRPHRIPDDRRPSSYGYFLCTAAKTPRQRRI